MSASSAGPRQESALSRSTFPGTVRCPRSSTGTSQLKAVWAEQAEAAKLAKESVIPVYQFNLTVDDQKFDKIYDDSVSLFKLTGVCLNQAEVDAVGGKTFTGSMSYLFNWASGRIIMSHGGGSIFISDGRWVNKNEIDDSARAFEELSNFIISNPEGGDVTSLIVAHQERRKA